MDVCSKTKLNQDLAFTNESFAGSSQCADGSSPSGVSCDLNRNQGEGTKEVLVAYNPSLQHKLHLSN